MPSVASVAPANVFSRVGVGRCVSAALFVGVGAGIFLTGRAYAAYEVDVWAPLGLGLVAVTAVILSGSVPSRLVAAGAAALVLAGAWSAASVAWGGLPNDAWKTLDQCIVAGSALVAGSLLASRWDRGRVVLAAVLAGMVAQAAEVLVRLTTGPVPEDWFYNRFLEGPVGYHNAQAAIFALGVPFSLWAAGASRVWGRIAGGAAGGVLLGALLLTQSRGALAALGLGLLVQLLWTRDLRAVVLAVLFVAAAVALGFALRPVDAAILEGDPSDRLAALREYGLWTGLAALALSLLAVPVLARGLTRVLAGGLAAALVTAVVVFSVRTPEALSRVDAAVTELRSDESPEAAAGETRITNLSLNGRREAWRVARELSAQHRFLGAGQGQFARRWTVERRLTGLYILQPHSLELELLSELGIVGLAVFTAFVALTAAGVGRSPDRAAAAAALGALAVLVLQASIDWTWSFPGLVVPVLLAAGASAAGMRRPLRIPALALAAVVLAALAASLAGPYLSNRQLARAAELQETNAGRSWQYAEQARKLNPWDPAVLSLQGRLAEATGEFRRAAARYRAAADLSQRPWLEHFRQARALRRAGAITASGAACRRAAAENPGEKLLRERHCRPREEGEASLD